MHACNLFGASLDKPKSIVARLALRKHKQRQRPTFAFVWKNKGQKETWIFSNVTEFKTGRRDRHAKKKFGNYSMRTGKSAGSLALTKQGTEKKSQLLPVEVQKTQQSAKRLQKKFSDKKLALADLSGTKNLVDIADLCLLV